MWFIGEKDLFRVDGEWLLVNGEWKLESGCWILQAVSSSARRKEGVSRTGLRINACSRYNFTLLRAVKPLELTRFSDQMKFKSSKRKRARLSKYVLEFYILHSEFFIYFFFP